MGSYQQYRDQTLRDDPNLKAEYDALELEYDIIQAIIDARKTQHLTQKQLSERIGMTQADISRIERGTRNPSLEMLKRLANGLGMTLKLVPSDVVSAK